MLYTRFKLPVNCCSVWPCSKVKEPILAFINSLNSSCIALPVPPAVQALAAPSRRGYAEIPALMSIITHTLFWLLLWVIASEQGSRNASTWHRSDGAGGGRYGILYTSGGFVILRINLNVSQRVLQRLLIWANLVFWDYIFLHLQT